MVIQITKSFLLSLSVDERKQFDKKSKKLNFNSNIENELLNTLIKRLSFRPKLKGIQIRVLRAILANLLASPHVYFTLSVSHEYYLIEGRNLADYNLTSYTISKVLNAMATKGYLLWYKGSQSVGLESRIKATPLLTQILEQIDIKEVENNGYRIILKDDEKTIVETDSEHKADLIAEIDMINKYCRDFIYFYDGKPMSAWNYRRIFNNSSYAVGGRLYDTDVQATLSKKRNTILVNGEPVVALDFKALHISMYYILKGKIMPSGDTAYKIPGFKRKTVKKAVNTILNCTCLDQAKRSLMFNIGLNKEQSETLIDEIIMKHPILHDIQENDGICVGSKLQYIDSCVLIRIVKRIIALNQEIPILLLHDGILTHHKHSHNVQLIMEEEMLKSGFAIPVEMKFHYSTDNLTLNIYNHSKAFLYNAVPVAA